jgi:hypothetical protein
MDRRLSAADFAKAFGSDEADIRRTVGPLVDKLAPGLKVYEGAERDELILKVLKRIYDIGLKSAGAERSGDWEDGWQENLDDFIACGYRVEALKPKYYKERVPHRFLGEFVLSEEPDFVYKYTVVFREWLFKTFFADAKTVYEFGCGTGHNLVHLGRLFPGKRLYGLDWAKSSQKILELARRSSAWTYTARISTSSSLTVSETRRWRGGSDVRRVGADRQRLQGLSRVHPRQKTGSLRGRRGHKRLLRPGFPHGLHRLVVSRQA